MAILDIEGFETRAAKGLWAIDMTRATFVTGRYGGSAIASSGTGNTTTERLIVGNPSTLIVHGAWKPPTGLSPGTNSRLFYIAGSDGTQHLFCNIGTGGVLQLYRGGSIGTSSGATPISTSSIGMIYDIWSSIEFKVSVHDTTGNVIVRINGIEAINFTGDTRNAGTGNLIGLLGLGIGNGTGSQMPLDDVYVLDTTGSSPYNDFMGDLRIETIVPNGNGNSSQFVGSDGNSTDNYLLVDELPASISDYVGSSTIGQKDTYAFANLTTTSAQILATQTSALAFKSDAGAANLKIVERLSSTERDSSSLPLTASPGSYISTGPQTTDPNGATWTATNVNAAEFGIKVD